MVGAVCLLAGTILAFANGGNDQFKGVATLYGSQIASFRTALGWATVTAAFGAIGAYFLGGGLIAGFSGRGLVPPAVVAMPSFSLAVGLAAAGTVMLATRFKMPVSTTHGLMGALVGAGWFASGSGVNLKQLGDAFLVPLLLSPVLSMALVLVLYPAMHLARRSLGVSRLSCVCIGTEEVVVQAATLTEARALITSGAVPSLSVGDASSCRERYEGRLWGGVSAGGAVDACHFLSAGAVCLARAMNDAPKMAAVYLIGGAISPAVAIGAVTATMLVGGLVQSRGIAETMGTKMNEMNPGQGFAANLATSAIVLFASKLGMPVSTTHVACGSLFGIGAANRSLRADVLGKILMAWVFTLPVAAALAAALFSGLRHWI